GVAHIHADVPQLELAGLRRCDGRTPELAEAHVTEIDRAADPVRGEIPLQVRERRDGGAADADDQVAHLEPRALRWSTRDHLENANAGSVRDAELVRELPPDRRRGPTDPEIRPSNATVTNEHARDHPRGRRGD